MFKLNVKAFALTTGLIWGGGLFCLTWWVMAFDGSSKSPTLIGRLYRGYTVSPLGSLIGLLWALPDGLIGGAIFAWLYNVIAGRLLVRRAEESQTELIAGAAHAQRSAQQTLPFARRAERRKG